MVVVNLELGRPTAQLALIQLKQSLASARARGTATIKLIHGYGSSGKGGAIKGAVHRELALLKSSGKIKEYVPGDEFSPFYANARRALELDPQLRKDMDYTRTNQGITIVVL